MSAPLLRPCEPWVNEDEIERIEGLRPEQRTMVVQAASEILWWLSGRRYGMCSVKVRPCRSMTAKRCERGIYQWPFTAPWGGMGYYPSLPGRADGYWYNIWCRCERACTCKPTAQLRLPRTPVCSVDQVLVDGVPLIGPDDESSGVGEAQYRVDDFRWLVRTDGETWMLDQDLDLPDTEPGTWSIEWHYGRPIPASGHLAAKALADELMKNEAKKKCALPQRITSITYENATVSMLDPQTFLDEGRTGIYLVDLFIKAVNPHGNRRQARIFRADAPPRTSRRVGT